MSKKGFNIFNALRATEKRICADMVIVETGTIRNALPQYEEGDGHSTVVFCEYVRENGGTFYSIDIKTDVALDYLFNIDLIDHVTLLMGTSTNLLTGFDVIDFAYLDSANDPQNCLDEFNIVWPKMSKGGCVMVDDCNEESKDLHKGDLLMPFLRNSGIEYTVVDNQIIIVK